MNSKQYGFGVIQIILLVIILGLIGFVGWRIYDAVTPTNKSVDETNISHRSSSTTNIPHDSLKYQRKDLGFEFTYPEQWGEAVLTERESAPVFTTKEFEGKEYRLTFSNNSTIVAELDTTDFKIIRGGGSGYSYTGPGFADYMAAAESLKSYSTVIEEQTSYLFVELLDCVDIGYVMRGLVPFKNSDLAGIGFGYFKNLQGAELCTASSNNASSYRDDTVKAQLSEVIKSVKQIELR